MRDPRIDPKPGDIVERPVGKSAIIVRRRVYRLSGGEVYYVSNRTDRCCWISTWAEWCRKATIVRRAEEESQP